MRFGFLTLCLSLASLARLFAQAPVAPFVVTHPTSVNTLAATDLTLTATIEGSLPIFYQWRKDGVAIAGANSSVLLLTTSLPAGATFSYSTYDLVATNGVGTVTTSPALVYVEKRPQTITFATPPAVISAGSGITLSATASSTLPVTFSIVSGLGSLGGSVLQGTGGPVVVRASQAGNANYLAAEPVERMVTFVAGVLSPFITTSPADQTALAGANLALRVSAIGTPTPTFQWQKDGTPISGATSGVLSFPNLGLTDAARYTVVASNLAGSVSASAQVTVRAAPSITTPPATQTITAGTPVSFSVGTAAFPAPTFQWRRNGTNLAGATRDTYSIASTLSAQAGNFDVIVTNALGTVTSPPATLTVVTRDFSGIYFGQLTGTLGDAVLQVRPDGTAAFFAHLPALAAGVAALSVPVDLSGNLAATVPLIAATARNLTFRGTVDEVAGRATATIAELSVTFEGIRAVPSAAGTAPAGLYPAALLNSAAGRGFVIIAPDGQFFLLTAAGTSIDSARGTLRADGRLIATTTTQAAVDLGINAGALRGTVRTTGANATTGTILGAIEGVAGTEHLVNLSVRAVTTPQAPMIVGFAISGTVGKQVLIRAAGPTLGRAPFNIAGALADPTLQLYRVNTLIGQNNDWSSPANTAAAITAAATQAGAFPFLTGSADSALVTTLLPGVYTVQIGGGTGVVLAEIYEVTAANEAPGSRRLVNTSTLGVIAPGFPLIAGFVISGTAPQRVLIRASGPTLAGAPFNVPSTLANPQLAVLRGATTVRTNDDWFRDPEVAAIREATTRARAFNFGNQSLDAAVLIYLEPGAYTAVVSAPANATTEAATGIALVEIYESNP